MAKLIFKRTTGNLPTSEYELVENGTSVGAIQVRHGPSHSKDVPAHMASHIYYEIYPQHRGKGYGKEILKQGLEKAKEIGLKEVIITCLEDNIASKKIIEANGGDFVEDATIPSTNEKLLKYKINL